MLRKIASPAPQDAAYASPRTFSAYEVDFTPVSAPFSLRRHGAVTIAVVGGRGVAGLDGDDQGRRTVRGPGAQRALAAGVGDPDLAPPAAPPVQHGGDPLADQPVVGSGQAHGGRRPGQPVQVPLHRERARRRDLQRLEHAVADHQAVVGDRDRRLLGLVEQRSAVAPHGELADGVREVRVTGSG